MLKKRLLAIFLIVVAVAIGYFVYSTENANSSFPFKLGLDLKGGTHLVYKADVSELSSGQISEAMTALRNVIEKRVNLFGVSEPVVQLESSGVFGGNGNVEQRLIVELPGVTDVNEAIKSIGKTPLLDFKLLKGDPSKLSDEIKKNTSTSQLFENTGLTGRYLQSAQVEFSQTTGEAMVSLVWNDQGKALFAEITKNNIGKYLAIFLDNQLIELPVIREEIPNGNAVISGGFNGSKGRDTAKELARNLNLGSLPVPIELISTQTIGSTLGQKALEDSMMAGIWGLVLVGLFLIVWYRLPGLLAVISLLVYVALNLAIFKLIPVTLTAAGIAGFILSIGMAVDANILIFERMKEELKRGRVLEDAVKEGFSRAWLSIRDSNLSSIITAVILFWFAQTSIIKGFALVFGLGVITSMFTAITASRTLLLAIKHDNAGRVMKFLFGNGFGF